MGKQNGKKMQLYLVFDVESVGLYGEGYAVGWVLIDQDGKESANGYVACPSLNAKGTDGDRAWINKNVDIHLPEPFYDTPEEVRNIFWQVWMKAKAKNAILVADTAYPVEANFLLACVNDDLDKRKNDGPYPLLGVESFLQANEQDPKAKYGRLANEKPEHHPTADARQSGRIFIGCINELKGKKRQHNTQDHDPNEFSDSSTPAGGGEGGEGGDSGGGGAGGGS
jgi:uncharacterized membrane protein YgcG